MDTRVYTRDSTAGEDITDISKNPKLPAAISLTFALVLMWQVENEGLTSKRIYHLRIWEI